MLPQVLDELAVVLNIVTLHAELVGDLAQMFHGSAGVVRTAVRHDLFAERLGERIIHADGLPVAAEIVFGAVDQRDLMGAEHVHRGLLHELLDQLADGVVGAVRLVGLDHRELGGVRGVDALVAEVAVDLEHAVDAAHEAALEEQFRRDAQIKVQVEGVHVRGERTGGGTAVDSLQHRRLDLDEVVVIERAAQRGDGLGPVAHHVAHLLIGDHADVRLARARVVVQVLVQGGQRLQRLGRDGPFGGEHRQLAGLGRDHAAAQVQVVAEVHELLELLERVSADLLLGDHALDLRAVAGRQLHEAQAAAVAQKQDAPGDADHVLGLLTGFKLAVILGAHGLDGVGHVEVHRVGLHAGLKHHRALGDAHLHLLGVRERAELLVGGVHGFVQRGTGADAVTDGCVLSQQHLGTLDRGHDGNSGCRLVVVQGFGGFLRLTHNVTV